MPQSFRECQGETAAEPPGAARVFKPLPARPRDLVKVRPRWADGDPQQAEDRRAGLPLVADALLALGVDGLVRDVALGRFNR
ncbi:MAG: hypothetical protein EHM71_12225 [Zetaproteobacteria bacterium]|nr:MAG: hypothetical protein EHM71_12225 [Zetaproteobacteria bacterium]